ncbi:MAG TPA: AMP-binding protein, partial [Ignavibacteriaceae bacterium]|nr:AMP-binding protein [Ignavibacteriaceae bacterium]
MVDKIKKELSSLNEAIQNNDKFNSLHLQNLICNYIEHTNREELDSELLKDFLCLSKHPVYLTNLPDREKRYEWADIAFKLIKYTDFSLLDLIDYSIKVNPDKPVFRTIEPVKNNFTYSFLKRRINIIASVIHNKYSEKPKAAIFANNSLDVALLDIACLSYDIFVAPFNVHFTEETLSYIFLKFKFNVIFTDNIQKVELLQKIKEKFDYKYDIVLITDKVIQSQNNYLTSENYFKLPINFSIDEALNKRTRFSLDNISTIMFTSGSTGLPKIVGFTNYNLLSKRFARGAALPFAGNDTFLSYLPLYHTFGRYLEMLGTLYWNSTYVFARKNDINTLMEYMRQVQPTVLISIPLRWQELHENFLLEYKENKKEGKQKAFEKVTGGKLKWGLSAAGYLEPKVFTFFNNMGV